MRILGLLGAALFAGVALYGVIPKQRRRAAAIGAPGWLPVLMLVVAFAYAMGALLASPLPMLIGVALCFPATMITRKRLADHEVPPPVRRIYDLSINPMRMLRHPIAHTGELFGAFGRPLVNKQETEQWYKERGL